MQKLLLHGLIEKENGLYSAINQSTLKIMFAPKAWFIISGITFTKKISFNKIGAL